MAQEGASRKTTRRTTVTVAAMAVAEVAAVEVVLAAVADGAHSVRSLVQPVEGLVAAASAVAEPVDGKLR